MRTISAARFSFILSFCFSAFLLSFSGKSDAQDAATFAGRTPEQIIARSAFSPSEVEKDILRGYVASHFPNTAPGLFARYWLETRDQRPKQAHLLLMQCLKKDPSYRFALYSLVWDATGQARLDAYTKLRAVEPKDSLFSLLSPIYEYYHGTRKDPQAAHRFVEAERKKRPGYFAFDVFDGFEAQTDRRDYKGAEASYLRALAKKPLTFSPYQNLTDLRLYYLSDGNTPLETRLRYFNPVQDFIRYAKAALPKAKPDEALRLRAEIYSAYLFLCERQYTVFKDVGAGLASCRAAFHVYPTAESALRVFGGSAVDSRTAGETFLLSANRILPRNYFLLNRLGQYYANRIEPEKAEAYLKASLACSPTETARVSAVTQLGDLYGNCYFDLERERTLYLEQMRKVQNRQALSSSLLYNRIDAGDYNGALDVLNELHDWMISQKIPVRRSYFLAYRGEINRLSAERERARNFDPAHSGKTGSAAMLPASTVAASHDGKYVLFGSRPMQLWDLKGGGMRNLGDGSPFVLFSPDDRFVATIAGHTLLGGGVLPALCVYKVETGRITARILDNRGPRSLAWSPDGSQIAYMTGDGRLTLCDVRAGKRVRARKVWLEKDIDGMVVWSKDGKFIATGSAQDTVIRLWDPATLRPLRTLDGVSWPHSLAETADGKYLACADDSRTLSVWDTAQWQRRQMDIATLSNSMTAYPNNDRILLNDFGGGANPQLISVDVSKMKLAAQGPAGQNSARYAITGDGNRIYEAGERSAFLYRAATLMRITPINTEAIAGMRAVSDEANHLYATYDGQGVHVWDVPSGKRIQSWVGVYEIVLWYAPRQFLTASLDYQTAQTHLFVLDAATGERKSLLDVPLMLDRVNVDASGYLVLAGKPFPRNNTPYPAEGTVILYSRKENKEAGRLKIPLVTEYLQYGAIFDAGFNGADIDGDTLVVSTYWQDGFGHSRTPTKTIRTYNWKTGKPELALPIGMYINSVYYMDGSPRRILAQTGGGDFFYNAKTGLPLGGTTDIPGENYLVLKTGERIR